MKRILLLFLFLSLVIAGMPFSVLAAADSSTTKPLIYPNPEPTPNLMEQQNQYYSVVLAGDGEVRVAAKLTLSNLSEQPINSVVVEIPGSYVRMVNALQEVNNSERYCIQYKPMQMTPEENNMGNGSGKGVSSTIVPPVCDQWGSQPYYSNPRYYTLQPNLQKTPDAYRYTLTLSQPVENQQSITLLLYYKAVGYVEKNIFGGYHFDFQTIKSENDVNTVRVAINVQDGFYLKGGKGKVDYKPVDVLEGATSMSLKGVSNSQIQSFSSQIPNVNGYVKETSGLDPWESFHVKGSYAENRLLLYLPEITRGVFGLIAVVALLILLWKALRRYHIKAVKLTLSPLVKTVGLGIGSAIGTLVSVGAAFYILSSISNLGIYYDFEPLIALLLVVLFFIVIIFISLGPLLFVGVRYGVKYAVIYIVVMIVSLILFTFGLLMVLQLLYGFGGQSRIEPAPMSTSVSPVK